VGVIVPQGKDNLNYDAIIIPSGRKAQFFYSLFGGGQSCKQYCRHESGSRFVKALYSTFDYPKLRFPVIGSICFTGSLFYGLFTESKKKHLHLLLNNWLLTGVADERRINAIAFRQAIVSRPGFARCCALRQVPFHETPIATNPAAFEKEHCL